MHRLRITILFLLVLSALGLISLSGWLLGYKNAADRFFERGNATLTLASDNLVGYLSRYKQLPVVLSQNPVLRQALSTRSMVDMAEVNKLLARVSDSTGALDIYLMSENGLTLAASNADEAHSFVGENFSFRPYFKQAMQGRLGSYHALGTTSGVRGFFFASPIRAVNGHILGVIAVKAGLEAFERDLIGNPQALFFVDKNNVIFSANRPSLIFKGLSNFKTAGADGRQYDNSDIAPLEMTASEDFLGFERWDVEGDQSLPHSALRATHFVGEINMTANLLLDRDLIGAEANLRGAIAGSLALVLAFLGYIFWQRRKVLTEKLALEARAKSALEVQVQARTSELTLLNEALTEEVKERRLAESRLKATQNELVQAGKLSALGQMSAGISHELNQPLMAIQTYADNAELLLNKQNYDEVQTNLSKISGLSVRMARIITNLRSFARKEGEPLGVVDLVSAIDGAVSIAGIRLEREGVEIENHIEAPLNVIGGTVRLQQVILNLISNAVDAMEEAPEKKLFISAKTEAGKVYLSIRDTGPGISDPSLMFDPFFTTKKTGMGTGLGLSISYGIVQSFGGEIRGQNHPDGGAIFTVELSEAKERNEAAE